MNYKADLINSNQQQPYHISDIKLLRVGAREEAFYSEKQALRTGVYHIVTIWIYKLSNLFHMTPNGIFVTNVYIYNKVWN